MDVTKHNKVLDTLESVVDLVTLKGTLDLLAEISSAKADHIRSNWQDEALAEVWDRNTARLLNAKDKLET